MHISEGALSVPILVGGAACGIALVSISLAKTSFEKLPKVALMSAVFFLGSLISVPVPPTSAHLVLSGFICLFLGWSQVLAIFLALILQALLFQFGGISVLGVNTVIIAAPSLLLYLLLRHFIKKPGKAGLYASFALGAGGIILSAILLFTVLTLSAKELSWAALPGLISNSAIGLLEGFITVLAVSWVRKNAPEFLPG